MKVASLKSIAMVFGIWALSLFANVNTAEAKTQYQVLNEAFREATESATSEDFEHSHWAHCMYVTSNDPQTARATRVRTVQIRVPSRGPLFPGRTEYRVDVFNDPRVDQQLYSYFQSTYEVPNSEYFMQVLDGPGWPRANIYGKVSRDVLLFHVAVSNFAGPTAPLSPLAYGYCWNDGDGDTPANPPPRRAPSRPTPPRQEPPQPQPVPPTQQPVPPTQQPVPPPPPRQKTVPPRPAPSKPAPRPAPIPGTKAAPVDTGEPMPLPPPPGVEVSET